MYDFDLVVIGGGAAGEKGAVQAAYFGKRVALIEREPQLGGAMVNTGTLPSKTLRETSLYLSGLKQRGLHGVELTLGRRVTVKELLHRLGTVMREGALGSRATSRAMVSPSFVEPRASLARTPSPWGLESSRPTGC